MNGNKAVNVALPVAVAERLRREAFEARVSQGSIVADALAALWDYAVCDCTGLHDRACPVAQANLERAGWRAVEDLGNGLVRERNPHNPDGWVYCWSVQLKTPVSASEVDGPDFEMWLRRSWAARLVALADALEHR